MASKWQLGRSKPGDFLPEDLKSEKLAADELGLSVSALRRLRSEGLPYLRVGRLIRYDLPSVVCWLLNNCDGAVGTRIRRHEPEATDT